MSDVCWKSQEQMCECADTPVRARTRPAVSIIILGPPGRAAASSAITRGPRFRHHGADFSTKSERGKIPIVRFGPAFFFFPPKRITSKFCRTTISKSQGTQSKTSRQENPHFGRAELRTHFYPHALPAPGPPAKGARATFPSPGRCPSRRSWGQTGCESGLGFGAGPFSLV